MSRSIWNCQHPQNRSRERERGGEADCCTQIIYNSRSQFLSFSLRLKTNLHFVVRPHRFHFNCVVCCSFNMYFVRWRFRFYLNKIHKIKLGHAEIYIALFANNDNNIATHFSNQMNDKRFVCVMK